MTDRPTPLIVMVAAVARNRVIGADNRLLWRLKSDMKHFRALTMGKALIMGRKTFDSIGKPLPGRHTVVLTRDPAFAVEGVRKAGSVAEAVGIGRAIAMETGTDEIMVAGGGEIYAAFMSRADRLEITEVALEPQGDAHFPMIEMVRWREESRRSFAANIDDEAGFAFISYVRR
jgi:dihydrofolate reductase